MYSTAGFWDTKGAGGCLFFRMILYVWPSLDCGRGEDALRAAQLCLQLLESTNRDELRRLLGFMAAAADNEAFRPHKQVNESSMCINKHIFIFF